VLEAEAGVNCLEGIDLVAEEAALDDTDEGEV
jgi:hypothetical protein